MLRSLRSSLLLVALVVLSCAAVCLGATSDDPSVRDLHARAGSNWPLRVSKGGLCSSNATEVIDSVTLTWQAPSVPAASGVGLQSVWRYLVLSSYTDGLYLYSANSTQILTGAQTSVKVPVSLVCSPLARATTYAFVVRALFGPSEGNDGSVEQSVSLTLPAALPSARLVLSSRVRSDLTYSNLPSSASGLPSPPTSLEVSSRVTSAGSPLVTVSFRPASDGPAAVGFGVSWFDASYGSVASSSSLSTSSGSFLPLGSRSVSPSEVTPDGLVVLVVDDASFSAGLSASGRYVVQVWTSSAAGASAARRFSFLSVTPASEAQVETSTFGFERIKPWLIAALVLLAFIVFVLLVCAARSCMKSRGIVVSSGKGKTGGGNKIASLEDDGATARPNLGEVELTAGRELASPSSGGDGSKPRAVPQNLLSSPSRSNKDGGGLASPSENGSDRTAIRASGSRRAVDTDSSGAPPLNPDGTENPSRALNMNRMSGKNLAPIVPPSGRTTAPVNNGQDLAALLTPRKAEQNKGGVKTLDHSPRPSVSWTAHKLGKQQLPVHKPGHSKAQNGVDEDDEDAVAGTVAAARPATNSVDVMSPSETAMSPALVSGGGAWQAKDEKSAAAAELFPAAPKSASRTPVSAEAREQAALVAAATQAMEGNTAVEQEEE